jgi:hypothetical protein
MKFVEDLLARMKKIETQVRKNKEQKFAPYIRHAAQKTLVHVRMEMKFEEHELLHRRQRKTRGTKKDKSVLYVSDLVSVYVHQVCARLPRAH